MRDLTEHQYHSTEIKPGYIYVLTHPSNPNLYKIGKTILNPLKRLAQHNSHYKEYAGQIVKETGQKWELKTFIEVPDPYHAESAFWGATPLADIPFLGGIEVHEMEWVWVEAGLKAAKKAGVRPPPPVVKNHSYKEWIKRMLKGSGITLLRLIDRSDSGTLAIFRCCNGHTWRGQVRYIQDGGGCPTCGVGERTAEEMQFYEWEVNI